MTRKLYALRGIEDRRLVEILDGDDVPTVAVFTLPEDARAFRDASGWREFADVVPVDTGDVTTWRLLLDVFCGPEGNA